MLCIGLQKAASDVYRVRHDNDGASSATAIVSRQHETLMDAHLASGCLEEPSSSGSEGGRRSTRASQESRRPVEELQMITATLSNEINDKHLIILDVLGRGGFATVS